MITTTFIRIFIALSLLSFNTQAIDIISYNPNLLANKQSCLSSPRLCLKQIDKSIIKVQKHHFSWYRLINFKLLAIWEIRDAKWLKKEVHQYIDLNNAPPVFLTTVYTLHAKLLFIDGEKEQGTLFANKAIELIKKVNDVSFDAPRYAEVIILYNQLKLDKSVKKFILWINERIAGMGPAHYFPKLQTAIAHTHLNDGDYDLALRHYQYALKGFIETNYPLESAEGYHNVARALQEKKDYRQAIVFFTKALEWMEQAVISGNYSVLAKNYTQLRLIESFQLNEQYTQAKSRLDEIKPDKISNNNRTLHQQLINNQKSSSQIITKAIAH
jgi:tetratricopeptide (TPR) repeat protein